MTAVKKFFLYFFGKAENSLAENIYLCMAVSFACGIFGYESAAGNMTMFNSIIGNFLFIAVWCYCAFVSGLKKRWGFLVFTGIYYIAPYLYMLYYAGRNNLKYYNGALAALNRLSELFFTKPLERTAEAVNSSVVLIVICLVIMILSVYFIGFFITGMKETKAAPSTAKAFPESDEENEEEYLDLTGKLDGEYVLSETDIETKEIKTDQAVSQPKKEAFDSDAEKSVPPVKDYTSELLFSKPKKQEDIPQEKTLDIGGMPEGYEEIYRAIMEEKRNNSR